MNKFNSFAKVNVECLNHSKHVEYLLKNDIQLVDINKDCKRLTFKVRGSDLKFVQEYFSMCGIECKVIAFKGCLGVAKALKQKVGLLVGIFVSVVSLIVAFNMIFDINITGNQKVSNEFVLNVILQQNKKIPIFKKEIDQEKIKQTLYADNQIALVSVFLRGGVLHVDINEQLDEGDIKENPYSPIIAKCDCIIEQVIAERGTAVVKKGQTVKKGDVLIAPYVIFDEASNIKYPTPAIGEVTAKVYSSQQIEFSENTIVVQKTGNVEYQRILIFDGKLLSQPKESEFISYEEQQKIIKIKGFPFEILQIERYETKEIEQYIPFDSVKEQIQHELLQKISETVKKDVQITNKWCIIRNIMGRYVLIGFVEYIDSVGVRSINDESG